MRICRFTRVRGTLLVLLLLLLLLLLSIASVGSPPRRKAKADPARPGARRVELSAIRHQRSGMQP